MFATNSDTASAIVRAMLGWQDYYMYSSRGSGARTYKR